MKHGFTTEPMGGDEAKRRAELDREIAAAATPKRKPEITDAAANSFVEARVTPHPDLHRQTFEIPNGCVAVLDSEGKATGGFVAAALADKLPGFKPIYRDGTKQEIVAVRSIPTPKAALNKLASAISVAVDRDVQLDLDMDMDVPGYEPLRRVLEEAYNQSARGKGRDRHAHEKPFLQQPIMEIGRMVGIGGHTYQISKKAQEAGTLASRGQHAAAKAELLGVIVYAAAAYLLTEESQ